MTLSVSRICERASIIDQIAREIVVLDAEERFRVWQERTSGARRATMYRRLEELARVDALVFES